VLPSRRAHLLAHGGYAAKLTARGSPRFVRRHPACLERCGGFIEVLLDFICDVAIGCRSIDQRA
jgi:hypothetical protein